MTYVWVIGCLYLVGVVLFMAFHADGPPQRATSIPDSKSPVPLPPKSFEEALERARSLLTNEEVKVLESSSLFEARIAFHLTFGYRIRAELGLWSEDAEALLLDMGNKLQDHLVFDADSASGALIDVLWHEYHREETPS